MNWIRIYLVSVGVIFGAEMFFVFKCSEKAGNLAMLIGTMLMILTWLICESFAHRQRRFK